MSVKNTSLIKDLHREFAPPVNRQMKELDRSFFRRDIPLVLAKLQDPSYFTILAKTSRPDLLQMQGISRIVKVDGQKGVLLKPDVARVDEVQHKVSPSTLETLKKAGAAFQPYTLTLDYDHWRAEEILAAVLPEDLLDEVPCGFTVVGHIAHMNIRDQYLPYKKMIGQVVFDKNPMIKTVVNKIDNIGTVFRTFEMEVLAGEPDFEVEQSESGCRFRFAFDKVYWNSRLHTEHDRLIRKFDRGQAVCDVFAGVGPFAVPAAKKGVIVFANDLNPDSYKSLIGNISLNKTQNFAYPYNEDGRVFIRNSVKYLADFAASHPQLEMSPKRGSRSNPKSKELVAVPKYFSHFVMNLPDSALEFLDAYVGMYNDRDLRLKIFGSLDIPDDKLPTVHCHCFYKYPAHEPEPTEEQAHEALRKTVSEKLSYDIAASHLSVHYVRKVAPAKNMYCISFKVPKNVAMRV